MPIRRFLTVLSLLLLISGCMQQTPYRVTRDLPPASNGKLPTQPKFSLERTRECRGTRCVYFIEFDEFGNTESRKQLEAGLTAADTVAKNDGTVVVYIHGWHHTARPRDGDVAHFLELVSDVKSKEEKDVVGIYVGWRGDSIDSDSPAWKPFSYLLTFWDRKATAHNIGNGGGVSELIRTLSDIRNRYQKSRLMVIGHSFGGAILYSAISQGIAEQIRRDAQNSTAYSAIADLVVLVNPAFEAMRLSPLYSFARKYEYANTQQPRLMIITTKADTATRVVFPIGRHIGTAFQSYPDDYFHDQDVTAIGHYEPFITHQLKVANCKSKQPKFTLVGADRPLSMCFENGAQSLLLTRCDSAKDCEDGADGHFITRGPAGDFIPHRFPIYNIRTTKDVMGGHVDIWTTEMKFFLFSLLEQVQHSERLPFQVLPSEKVKK
ncbi:alpha/beta hydrolase [Pseudomonas chlororaphis]|uniref:alpha/beta hydrolase n=1 Tax=Pseudomonas chlororaphis TaxID=587753 RepID=UPI00131FAD3E|nr:alpha/beta hydrolase [Pseudomonas chlororaphis]QHC92604.1 hypothetical protein PchlR47_31300 [Pseudomonas chlororaphis]